MSAHAYSLRNRLKAFFEANPGVELTRAEIAAKFFVTVKTTDNVLRDARKEGWLESVHAHRLARVRGLEAE